MPVETRPVKKLAQSQNEVGGSYHAERVTDPLTTPRPRCTAAPHDCSDEVGHGRCYANMDGTMNPSERRLPGSTAVASNKVSVEQDRLLACRLVVEESGHYFRCLNTVHAIVVARVALEVPAQAALSSCPCGAGLPGPPPRRRTFVLIHLRFVHPSCGGGTMRRWIDKQRTIA